MAIDWTKVIISADGDTIGAAAGQVVIFASGVKGDAATIIVDETVTLDPGEDASVENVGDEHAAHLRFGIPRGDTGAPGANATIDVDSTVTLNPGEDALVENIGTEQNARLKFSIPRGATGVWGGIIGAMSDQTDLQSALNAKADLANEIMYFSGQTVSVASGAQIMRIPSSGTDPAITTDTVVLECCFRDDIHIVGNVSWESYNGYVAFTGTCIQATTADVTLGTKGN